jgi:hypothetical protein
MKPTLTEKKIIITEQIKKSPDNLSKAFRQASKILGISPIGCSNVYYNQIKKKTHLLSVSSERGGTMNVKNNLTSNKALVIRNNIFKGIFRDMSKEEVVNSILLTFTEEEKQTFIERVVRQIQKH